VSESLRPDVLQLGVAKINNLEIDVTVLERIDSTNDWSLGQCRLGRVLPFACFAESQTAGKGRRGKQWLMAARANIATSVSWPFNLSRQPLHLLPLSIALAVVKTLEAFDLQEVQIKWPNDIYVQGRKVAGILIETQRLKQKKTGNAIIRNQSENGGLSAVVIGVGLNYDMSAMPLVGDSETETAEMLFNMTDISSEIKRQSIDQVVERESVAAKLLQNIVSVCQSFQQNSPQMLAEFCASYDFCKGKTVDVLLDNQSVLRGVAQGVNERAELIVMVDGENRIFNSAEVSVQAELK